MLARHLRQPVDPDRRPRLVVRPMHHKGRRTLCRELDQVDRDAKHAVALIGPNFKHAIAPFAEREALLVVCTDDRPHHLDVKGLLQAAVDPC